MLRVAGVGAAAAAVAAAPSRALAGRGAVRGCALSVLRTGAGEAPQPPQGALSVPASPAARRSIHSKISFERSRATAPQLRIGASQQSQQSHAPAESLPSTAGGPNISVEAVQGARVISLNKPATGNGLDYRLLRQLRRHLIQLESNDRVQAVVLRGATDAIFSRGVDLMALSYLANHEQRLNKAFLYYQEQCFLAQVLATYTKPIVTCAHGVAAGSALALALNSSTLYVSDNTQASFPETAFGLVPTAGATYHLAHLDNGVGMYMGLTGAAMTGEELYWAGVADHYAPVGMLGEVPDALGAMHSFAAWDHVMEHDPVYRRNLAALRACRGQQRWNFVVDHMPEGTNREALESYVQDKDWYNNLGETALDSRGRPPMRTFMDPSDKGDLFDFGAGQEVDGWDQLPEPLSRALDAKNALGASAAHAQAEAAGCLDAGPSDELLALLDMVKRCFGGDVAQGDAQLEIDAAASEPRAPRSRDQWLDAIKDRKLPTDAPWESRLPVSVRTIVTDVYAAVQLVPHPAELDAVVDAVQAAVPRAWPLGTLDDVRLDDLCNEFKVPDRKELYDVVQGAVTLATARLHGVPPGPLVHPERLARQQQEREDAEQRTKKFSDQGKELSPQLTNDPSNVTMDDVLYHLQGGFMDASSVRPVDLLPEDEMQSRLPWTEGLEELGETPYDPRAAHPSERHIQSWADTMESVRSYLDRRGVDGTEARKLMKELDDMSLSERHKMPKSLVESLDFLEQYKALTTANMENDAGDGGDGRSGPAGGDGGQPGSLTSLLDSLPDGTGAPAADGGAAAASVGGADGSRDGTPRAGSAWDELLSSQRGPGPTLADLAAASDDEGDDEHDAMWADFKRKVGADATKRANSSETPSAAYLAAVARDPEKMVAAFGLPRTQQTLAAADTTAEAFVTEDNSRLAPVHPRSVEEIKRRLRSEDTPAANDALRELERRDPLAVEATHRLILEASQKQRMEDCLAAEFRVTTNLLRRQQTVEALRRAAYDEAPAAASDVSQGDVDALFASSAVPGELQLPLRSSRLVHAARDAEVDAWKDNLVSYLESGEAQGVVGNMMKRRVVWW